MRFAIVALISLLSMLNGAVLADQPDDGGFLAARPVWPESRRLEMNTQVRFEADYRGAEDAVLRVASSNPYRIRLNGKFAGYGPARGPKGFFRVDEWPLSGSDGENRVEIEVAGYNASSYYFQNQPSFLKAEICRGREVLAATGVAGAFTASNADRLQKTVRFSGQRMFTEVYRIGSGKSAPRLALEECPAVRHLPRIVPYPDFGLNRKLKVIARSKAVYDPSAAVRPNRHADWMPGKDSRTAFAKTELEVNSWEEAERTRLSERRAQKPVPAGEIHLERESVTVDAGLNDCGFPGMTVDVEEPGRLLFMFDEILSDGKVDYSRMKCVNVIEWFFDKPGRYKIEAFEPYGFRYAEIAVPDGNMKISGLYIREYKNPDAKRASFRCSDPALNRIFTAAKETFVQNAVDVFTDCPGRERAGWLCDSFFIGRVNHLLTGNTESERLFLQNYALPESFDHVEEGMVPMCYPGDHPTGRFIPNWAMWLVLQTEEYLHRSGDRETVQLLKPRLLGLYDYLKRFYNSDGLLEKLPKWVFIEWSKSNRLVQDVSYPSNMMWAEVLDSLDRLYGRPELSAEAKRIRETVRRQSWTGKWFCDNAKRMKDGTLKPTGICTETCQYYAFFFGTATPETHPELWRTLLDDFGPKRSETGLHPDIAPSNAFIGNYLRLELLSREGLARKIVEETRGYFLSMADRTGTLWEHDKPTASCCHGFASHVAVCLFRDVLGIRSVDGKARSVKMSAPSDVGLKWCEGELPVSAEETVFIRSSPGGKPLIRWGTSADFERMPSNAPSGETRDLKVGLWAWPVPLDWDGDGDFDLAVSCPCRPYNGTYLFRNPGGTAPVFSKGERIGDGHWSFVRGNSARDGKNEIFLPGVRHADFPHALFAEGERFGNVPDNVHSNSLQANVWREVDFDGDGRLDLLVGTDDWAALRNALWGKGMRENYSTEGRWIGPPNVGNVYLVRRLSGDGERPRYAKPELLRLENGEPMLTEGSPMPMCEDWDGDGDFDIICGCYANSFTWFENTGTRTAPRYAAGRPLLAVDGAPLEMHVAMITPSAFDWDGDGRLDIICGDEDGRMAFIRGADRPRGEEPRFEKPVYFRQEADDLNFGALSTPCGVDWDGDGDWDIISGNTAGEIAFIENLSGPGVTKPRWAEPVKLKAGGKEIRIMAGINGSIQGPVERNWGYTCLTAADWDGDGLPDLMVNTIKGDVVWFRNVGTRDKPELAPAADVVVEWEGDQPSLKYGWYRPRHKANPKGLLTQWRTTPVMFDWNGDGLMDLVMLDHEGYLAFFERERKSGRLVLLPPKRVFADKDGRPLRLNGRPAGHSGRRKLAIADMNGDGRPDLLVDGANIDIRLNLGTEDGMTRLSDPLPAGRRALAKHSTAPTTVDFNGDGRPELIAGAEDGYFYYLSAPDVRIGR